MADEIEVEIESPVEVNGAVVVTPDEKVVTPDPAVEDLREQLKAVEARELAEKTARTTAEAQAREHQAEVTRLRESETKARGETVDSQLDAVANAEAAAKAEADAAERDYATAMENADYKAAASAQRKMANAEGRLLALGQSKSDIERERKAPPKVERQPERVDPHEAFIQTRTPATQAWLRQHMDALTNPQMNAIAVGADAEAQRKGIKADTPEYFELIETRLGYRQEQEEVIVDPKPKVEQKTERKVVRSAPVSREANGQQGNGKQTIRLTQEEAARATDGTHVWDRYDKEVMEGKVRAGTPIGHHEMARRKQIMQMNGEYDRKGDE